MEYFANPYFKNTPYVYYLDEGVLSVINAEYDISTVFFARGFTRRKFRENGHQVPKNKFFNFNTFLVGAGRVVVCYPFHISTKRRDPLYGFLTGNYELYKVNTVRIETVGDQKYVLKDFMGRDDPSHPLQYMRGPLGAPIKTMIYEPEQKKGVLVLLGLAWWTFEHPNFSRYNPPLYVRNPSVIGLPADFIRNTKQLATR